jgi:Leucine-rich repeat (LRR) protein
MTKQLTSELVQQKCKTSNLSMIKNLNLCGTYLEDVSLLNTMTNLEVLSLSVNCIKTLSAFSNLSKLQELYLRKNSIENF